MRMTRDSYVALFLLALCGVFFHASFDIEVTNYGTIQSSLWPRVILTALTAMSALFLVTSLRRPDDGPVVAAGGFSGVIATPCGFSRCSSRSSRPCRSWVC